MPYLFYVLKNATAGRSQVEPGRCFVYGLCSNSQMHSGDSTDYKYYSFTAVYMCCCLLDCKLRVGSGALTFQGGVYLNLISE